MVALIILGATIVWLLGVVVAYFISLNKDEQTSFFKLFIMSLFITPVLLIIVEELKPYAPREEVNVKLKSYAHKKEVEEEKTLGLNQNQQSQDASWENALDDLNL